MNQQEEKKMCDECEQVDKKTPAVWVVENDEPKEYHLCQECFVYNIENATADDMKTLGNAIPVG